MLAGKVIYEACVETLAEAVMAERKGAHRLELCTALDVDGLTPSTSLTTEVLRALQIPVKVMIRCRAGGFEYTNEEILLMESQLMTLAKLGIAGFVFGALDGDQLDLDAIERMAQVNPRIPMTVHKAIDHTCNLVASAKSLLAIEGVDSILTSGGAETALEGAAQINAMYDAVSTEMTIIAAGRITPSNVPLLKRALKTQEYHGRRIMGNL